VPSAYETEPMQAFVDEYLARKNDYLITWRCQVNFELLQLFES
jgi:hypothetical protein